MHLDSSESECSRVIGNDVFLGILQPDFTKIVAIFYACLII